MFIYLSPTMRAFRVREGGRPTEQLFAVETWNDDRLEWLPSNLGLVDAKSLVAISSSFEPCTPRATARSLKPHAITVA